MASRAASAAMPIGSEGTEVGVDRLGVGVVADEDDLARLIGADSQADARLLENLAQRIGWLRHPLRSGSGLEGAIGGQESAGASAKSGSVMGASSDMARL
jgi:hypothetical protein